MFPSSSTTARWNIVRARRPGNWHLCKEAVDIARGRLREAGAVEVAIGELIGGDRGGAAKHGQLGLSGLADAGR